MKRVKTFITPLVKEIHHSPLLWLLAFVPVVFVVQYLSPDSHTPLFILSILAIVPLAALLSHATESVAAKTGDSAGGLLIIIATMTISLVTQGGRSAWFIGAFVLIVYLIFAMTLYILPPQYLLQGIEQNGIDEKYNS